jgi:threonine/homoserine/homoserine lactone efflux protein
MGEAIGEMLAMAVAVAVSPIPIIAVVLLLVGPGGSVKGVAYVIGSVVSTAIVGGVLVAVGVGSGTSSDGGPSTGASLLKLVLGVLLLVLAAKQWRGRPLAGEEAVIPSWMGALDGFTPVKALGAGVVLNVFNPKNLLFIVGGAAAVAGAGASGSQEAVAWAIFCLIATIGVATPVVIVFATGDRSAELLDRLKTWMSQNSGVIMAVILLMIGVKLVGDGIAGL